MVISNGLRRQPGSAAARTVTGSILTGSILTCGALACSDSSEPSAATSEPTATAAPAPQQPEPMELNAAGGAALDGTGGATGGAGAADDAEPASAGGMQQGGGGGGSGGQGGEAPIRTTAGCDKQSPTGEQLRTIEVLGVEREYEVFVSDGYDPSSATRLIFFGSSGESVGLISGSRRSCVVVTGRAAGGRDARIGV